MLLRNDFHVAKTHTRVNHAISQFILLAKELAAEPPIQNALENGPAMMVRHRKFHDIVADDLMHVFADVMEIGIASGGMRKEDVPKEFFLKLMKDRYGPSIKKQEAEKALFDMIDEFSEMPSQIRDSYVPEFLQLVASDMPNTELAELTNRWLNVNRMIGTLLMNEQAIAATDAVNSINRRTLGVIQPIINKKREALEKFGGSGGKEKPTGPNAEKDKEQQYKIHHVNEIGEIQDELDKLVGMDEQKEQVREIETRIRHARIRRQAGIAPDNEQPSFEHYVFRGPPGTGKTTFARLIGKIYHENGLLAEGHVVEVDSGDLIAGYIRQTADMTKKAVNAAIDGVLFIDEAYLLNGEGKDFGKEAIGTLLKSMELEKDRIVVIIAGYPEPIDELIRSNPGMTRRFKHFLDFKDFTMDELMRILDKNLEKHRLEITPEARLVVEKKLTENKKAMGVHFGNAGTVENMVELMRNKLSKKLEDSAALHEADELLAAKKPLPEELKKVLVTITEDIVAAVKLGATRPRNAPSAGGLSSKFTPSSLGGDFVPANDSGLPNDKHSTPPPAAAPAPKGIL